MQSIYHYSPWEWVQCLPRKEGEECNIQKYHIQEKETSQFPPASEKCGKKLNKRREVRGEVPVAQASLQSSQHEQREHGKDGLMR